MLSLKEVEKITLTIEENSDKNIGEISFIASLSELAIAILDRKLIKKEKENENE